MVASSYIVKSRNSIFKIIINLSAPISNSQLKEFEEDEMTGFDLQITCVDSSYH